MTFLTLRFHLFSNFLNKTSLSDFDVDISTDTETSPTYLILCTFDTELLFTAPFSFDELSMALECAKIVSSPSLDNSILRD